jgi:hypothetical protein
MKSETSMKIIKPPLFGTIAITCGLSVCGYSQSFLTNGLVAYYPFDGNANDAVGTNNGTVIGSDWKFLPDRFGNPQSALFLNTTSPPTVTLNGAYVSARRSSALNFSNDFTLSVWVNNSSGVTNQQETLISNGNDGLGFIDLAIDPSLVALGGKDRLAFDWGDGSAVNGVMAPAPNSWRQFVVVRSGTNTTIFENGVALTNTVTLIAPSNSPTIWLGRFQPVPSGNQNTLPLFGGIDDVRIYNRALSSNEVQQLFVYESGPRVDLIQIVQPSLSNLSLGTNYQLQVSTDLNSWTNQGAVFTATNTAMVYPQYFDVESFEQLFFRVQVVP